MICPVCRKGALIVEYNNIELDYCPKCEGVWFDSGELELLLESAGLGDYRSYLDGMINAPETATSEKKRKCPICRRKMKKTYIDEGKNTLVDVCHRGDGIWFDKGEVQSLVNKLVIKSPAKSASSNLLSFVGDMFQHRKE
jgi:Zn-finger nucleic acid-binding protein